MAFPAHIRYDNSSNAVVQSAAEHSKNTAVIAKSCAEVVGLGNTAYMAGLLHDCGKFKNEFKDYIEKASSGEKVRRGSVNHTFAGVVLALNGHSTNGHLIEILTSEVIAYAVGAHHGLFDCVGEDHKNGFDYRLNKQDVYAKESISNFSHECVSEKEIKKLFDIAVDEVENVLERIKELVPNDADDFRSGNFYIGLLCRTVLSAVIEGDRRDTTRFMSCEETNISHFCPDSSWKECLERVERKLATLPINSPINKARHDISDMCKEFAAKENGIYRLNVPTGAGKTLSSLRYALTHADQYKKRRIIFTAPLLSILEQNAAVIRDFVGDDSLILEHHSNVVREHNSDEDENVLDLLAESWEAPIIITTMVQLLNTMFSGSTGSIRRFNALSDSIIVIDEIQTVPMKLLSMFNLAVNFLSQVCNATFVFCSATQPCLEKVAYPIFRQAEDIVPYNEQIWSCFKRTKVINGGSCKLTDISQKIIDILKTTKSILIICNRKDEAAELFKQVQYLPVLSCHLSAGMCVEHRRDAMRRINAALDDLKALSTEECIVLGKQVVCVSTQVIEAGVDVSFECVLRFSAGMDSIIQAAGRCNRNGESKSEMPVYILKCEDEKLEMLPEIRLGQLATHSLLLAYEKKPTCFLNDLSSDAAIEYYYRSLYKNLGEGYMDYPVKKEGLNLLDLLSENVKYRREDDEFMLHQAFFTAGKFFEVFDENTTDVLVPYGKGRELIDVIDENQERIKYDMSFALSVIERAKGYTVSLYDYQIKALGGMLKSIAGNRLYILPDVFYNKDTGVSLNQGTNGIWEV